VPHVAIVCGRYEGVDERVRCRVTDELSIGDYVLTGGELPALVVVDAVARLVPGVVGDAQSIVDDSFSRGLLDFPQYTRPARFTWPGTEGEMAVPDVLLSGNHADIRRWRTRAALTRTFERRPDLLTRAQLDDEEQAILRELQACGAGGPQKGRRA
jgi:tRNA (guanine37-N1)-methyltransferase